MPKSALTPPDTPARQDPGLPAGLPDLAALLLADKRSEATKRAYGADLRAFFSDLRGARGAPAPAEVLAFCRLSVPQIALCLGGHRAQLEQRQLAPATISRRLAAVRSLLGLARRIGLTSTDARGLVESPAARAYRDTTGLPVETIARLLSLPDRSCPRGLRDAVLLRLLWENALRRQELLALNVCDLEWGPPARLMIVGKGQSGQREPIALTPRASEELAAYLSAREAAGETLSPALPLFGPLGRGRPGSGRLTGDALRRIVVRYARLAGVTRAFSPHRLRHSSITAALEATGGDVRRVQRLSRHADLRTLSLYDDNRQGHQAAVSALLSDLA